MLGTNQSWHGTPQHFARRRGSQPQAPRPPRHVAGASASQAGRTQSTTTVPLPLVDWSSAIVTDEYISSCAPAAPRASAVLPGQGAGRAGESSLDRRARQPCSCDRARAARGGQA